MEKLSYILNHITKPHYDRLMSFYRDSFSNDDECLQFLYEALLIEKENHPIAIGKNINNFADYDNSNSACLDHNYIPRRMLNTVERLVSVARDMEKIRKGRDVFKIIYLVTCAETLHNLSIYNQIKNQSKKDILFNFFDQYTSSEDKRYIAERFEHDDEDALDSPDSFRQFIAVLNEYRNCATHEGEYWDFCFCSNNDNCPLKISAKIDLEAFSGNPNKKKRHGFSTNIRYSDFEKIFIRTCIAFIQSYVKQQQ